MNIHTIKKNVYILLSSLFLISCSQKNTNFDIDLSDLPKPKKIKTNNQVEKNIDIVDNKLFIKELVPFEDKEKLLSNTKFGKKDPFSKEGYSNKLTSDFKLTGFLNTSVKKFVLVKYLDNEGTLSEDSIGGINTDLLPNGAKVIFIDPSGMKLKINFENENFVFEL